MSPAPWGTTSTSPLYLHDQGHAVQTIGPGDALGWSWLFAPHRWHFTARAVESVAGGSDVEEVEKGLFSERFLLARPVLRARPAPPWFSSRWPTPRPSASVMTRPH